MYVYICIYDIYIYIYIIYTYIKNDIYIYTYIVCCISSWVICKSAWQRSWTDAVFHLPSQACVHFSVMPASKRPWPVSTSLSGLIQARLLPGKIWTSQVLNCTPCQDDFRASEVNEDMIPWGDLQLLCWCLGPVSRQLKEMLQALVNTSDGSSSIQGQSTHTEVNIRKENQTYCRP